MNLIRAEKKNTGSGVLKCNKKKNEEEVVDSESTTSKTIVLEKDYRIDAGNAAGRYSLFIKNDVVYLITFLTEYKKSIKYLS